MPYGRKNYRPFGRFRRRLAAASRTKAPHTHADRAAREAAARRLAPLDASCAKSAACRSNFSAAGARRTGGRSEPATAFAHRSRRRQSGCHRGILRVRCGRTKHGGRAASEQLLRRKAPDCLYQCAGRYGRNEQRLSNRNGHIWNVPLVVPCQAILCLGEAAFL